MEYRMASRILFPRAFAFAIDDLGWNEGSDLSRSPQGGPHRAGVKRKFDIQDYKYIVEVGKTVGARIQCLFILSEMDRKNILAKFPTTTYQREQWNNSGRVSEEQLEIMKYVCDQSAWMEFGLHGTGHEYWAPGEVQKRAEWYNLADKKPWPEQSLREHIQCFRDVMAQYGLTPENGHSFPESFVPCAYSYYWNPTGTYSLGKLLAEAGVKYANTDFSQIPELNPPQEVNGGGFDHGVHVINRINYGNQWYELATLPVTPLQDQQTDIIESHWPNWLAQDDFLQPDISAQWIDYYKQAQRSETRYIAKNTEQLHAQWLYKKYAVVTETSPGVVEIDNTQMPDAAYNRNLLGNLVLKVKLQPGEHLSEALLGKDPVPGYFEEEGFGFLYLPPLKKERYTLRYSLGTHLPPTCIYNDGTFNVYYLKPGPGNLKIKCKVYGEQTLKINCQQPAKIVSVKNLTVISSHYAQEKKMLELRVKGADMQGSCGEMEIVFDV